MASVRDDPQELRYELLDDSGVVIGQIRYVLEPGAVVLVHTEVDPELQGHGLAGELVQGAMNDLRERGLKVIPVCPYVRAWLRRHPEQADLVVGPRTRLRHSANTSDVSAHALGDAKHERRELLEDVGSPDEAA
jgi:uncharacterized protein